MKITFDGKCNALVSKDKLVRLIKKIKPEQIFSEIDFLNQECYVLVDRNGKDFYPFPFEEIDEWEKDGSFEPGDTLYKISKLKTY